MQQTGITCRYRLETLCLSNGAILLSSSDCMPIVRSGAQDHCRYAVRDLRRMALAIMFATRIVQYSLMQQIAKES